uniref:Protein FAR1-related sequence 6 n=1 Tax=Tanacetum cinerariifolium TaxID=118510 RepID=A0A699I5N5_TANCI|nr:protein FAR1-related sequence 6 [Tanacetum cinerariifolium]
MARYYAIGCANGGVYVPKNNPTKVCRTTSKTGCKAYGENIEKDVKERHNRKSYEEEEDYKQHITLLEFEWGEKDYKQHMTSFEFEWGEKDYNNVEVHSSSISMTKTTSHEQQTTSSNIDSYKFQFDLNLNGDAY